MRIVFMGSPDFAVEVLERLVLNGHQVVAVYTRPDRPAGRGRASLTTPVKNAAQALGLPVVQSPTLKTPAAAEELAAFHPAAIVVAAFGNFLPPQVLAIPRYGCLNIHPSLLPRYRGASPVISTILAGDPFAGVSVMRLDAGMDSGPVFTQARIPVLEQDTATTLTAKLFRIGSDQLLEVLAALPAGWLAPQPQDEYGVTVTREVQKEDGRIDWQLPAIQIGRMVRAYNPWPGTQTLWQRKRLTILEAVPWPEIATPGPGKITAVPAARSNAGAGFGVGTGEGVLGIVRVQMEGKRALLAAEFIRGSRDFVGGELI